MNVTPVKRALLSVANKSGIAEFAQQLTSLGIDIVSTGGTSQALQQAGIAHRQVDEITGFPGMLEGRVKTLHPKIHGGILGRRDVHREEAEQHQIEWLDLVIVNFYPFADAIKKPGVTWEEAIEHIDVGGPTMVRAAAKNCAWVGVVVDPHDYPLILAELKQNQGLTSATKKYLAQKAFALTHAYDGMIQDYFLRQNAHEPLTSFPEKVSLSFHKFTDLRYGENPHQKACAYQREGQLTGILAAHQYQGKPLSYNNILDAEAAYVSLNEFTDPTCVIIKHANPCGVASAETIEQAFAQAYAADSLSAFGGVIALNRLCTQEIAEKIATIFTEVILAPTYSTEALALFASKPNLRVLTLPAATQDHVEYRFVTGGVLLQEKDQQVVHLENLKTVTKKIPTTQDLATMLFAWRILKHIKSNAILIAKDKKTVGIGAGQVSRIESVEIALRKASTAAQGAILASDAFFPFRDSIDRLAHSGISAIIQPGGSLRDEEVIAACDEHDIAMVFTGMRCFRH